jgi:hypothetical protein
MESTGDGEWGIEDGKEEKGARRQRGIKRRFFTKVKKQMGEEGIEEDREYTQPEERKPKNGDQDGWQDFRVDLCGTGKDKSGGGMRKS